MEAQSWGFGEGVRWVLPTRAPASGGTVLVIGGFGLSSYGESSNYTVVFSTLDVPEEALAAADDAESNSTVALVVTASSPNHLEVLSSTLNPSTLTPSTLHSTPYTTPYTLHPTPYTLHPTPQALVSKPETLNPEPSTLNTRPKTRNP